MPHVLLAKDAVELLQHCRVRDSVLLILANVIIEHRLVVLHAGDRICQFRIIEHQPQLIFEAVETLGNEDRGGIGSTGKR